MYKKSSYILYVLYTEYLHHVHVELCLYEMSV